MIAGLSREGGEGREVRLLDGMPPLRPSRGKPRGRIHGAEREAVRRKVTDSPGSPRAVDRGGNRSGGWGPGRGPAL